MVALRSLLGLREPQSEEQIQILQAEVSIPFPTARVPQRLVEAEKQRSYEEVANSLGFEPAGLLRAQLLEFFEQEGFNLYNYGQVSAWLTEKKIQAGAEHWCWRALREKDVIKNFGWGRDKEADGHPYMDGFYSTVDLASWHCRPYDRLVPLHAIIKVEKIEKKFGDRVKFFVSDYATGSSPDPFIMVRPATTNDSNILEYLLVFDAWDEPGFGISS